VAKLMLLVLEQSGVRISRRGKALSMRGAVIAPDSMQFLIARH
jgi:hypothetical protein